MADVRASTPSVAGRLVVPDLTELLERLDRARAGLERGARRSLDRERRVSTAPTNGSAELRGSCSSAGAPGSSTAQDASARFRRASTLERGYAIVRAEEQIIRSGKAVEPGDRVEIELAEGGFGARVEETR